MDTIERSDRAPALSVLYQRFKTVNPLPATFDAKQRGQVRWSAVDGEEDRLVIVGLDTEGNVVGKPLAFEDVVEGLADRQTIKATDDDQAIETLADLSDYLWELILDLETGQGVQDARLTAVETGKWTTWGALPVVTSAYATAQNITLGTHSNDRSGRITIAMSPQIISIGAFCKVTFATPKANANYDVWVQALGQDTALLGQMWVPHDKILAGSFEIHGSGLTLLSSRTYRWAYHVIDRKEAP